MRWAAAVLAARHDVVVQDSSLSQLGTCPGDRGICICIIERRSLGEDECDGFELREMAVARRKTIKGPDRHLA